MAERFDRIEVPALQGDACCRAAVAEPRVTGENHGGIDGRKCVDDRGEAGRIVGVLGPVDRREDIGRGRESTGQEWVVVWAPGDVEQDVDHHVADHPGAVGKSLVGEMAGRDVGGSEEQVRSVIGEDSVVFFGHGPVERAESRFEMCDSQMQLYRSQRPGERGVGVAVDEDPVGLLAGEQFVELRQHGSGLDTVTSGADLEIPLWLPDAEFLEEDLGHAVVIVLPRVDGGVVDTGRPGGLCDRSEFDELGTGANNADDSHRVLT